MKARKKRERKKEGKKERKKEGKREERKERKKNMEQTEISGYKFTKRLKYRGTGHENLHYLKFCATM
jgi:hypothetical protein